MNDSLKSGESLESVSEGHADFAEFHEQYIRHYIAFADTKAGVIFTLAAGLFGFLLGDEAVKKALFEPESFCTFAIPALSLFLLTLTASFAFLVIAPRLSSKSGEGLVFFGAVADRKSATEYIFDVGSSSIQELTEARLKHCYDIAVICQQKYKFLKYAIWITPFAVLSSFLGWALA